MTQTTTEQILADPDSVPKAVLRFARDSVRLYFLANPCEVPEGQMPALEGRVSDHIMFALYRLTDPKDAEGQEMLRRTIDVLNLRRQHGV